MQAIRTIVRAFDRLEDIFLQQVEDRHGALVLDLRTAPDDRALVERDMNDTMAFGTHGLGSPKRIATDRA
jgi:hypothetical protein